MKGKRRKGEKLFFSQPLKHASHQIKAISIHISSCKELSNGNEWNVNFLFARKHFVNGRQIYQNDVYCLIFFIATFRFHPEKPEIQWSLQNAYQSLAR